MPNQHKNPGLGWHPPAELQAYARAEAERRGVHLKVILDEALARHREDEPRAPADLAQAITTALEEAAIADWDAGDGKVIEIYVSRVADIVERVLGEQR